MLHTEQLTTPYQCWLEMYREPLLTAQRAKHQAQLRADNAPDQ